MVLLINVIYSEIITANTRYSGIYVIINLVNNKFYVGSSVDLWKRALKHFSNLRKGKHDNQHLQNSYNKYGKKYFIAVEIEKVDNKDNLTKREQYWMDELDVCNKEIGYNILPKANSTLGHKHSEETKKRMSKAKSNPSQEIRDKIRQSKFKKVVQLTTNGEFIKEWKSISHAGNELKFIQGHISSCCCHTRQTHKGFMWVFYDEYILPDFNVDNLIKKHKTKRGLTTLQYDLDGNFIKEWHNAKIAANELNLNHVSITQCCTGEYKKSQGFIWKYAQEVS